MSPILEAFCGPNGSGKSTIIEHFSPPCDIVNADEIQNKLGCSPMDAAIIAEKTREALLADQKDFAFETVLSTDRNLILMTKAKSVGYYIRCYYVLTKDPAINLQRVATRYALGGHDVPPDKVIGRYARAMKLIPKLLDENVCDECYIFDNSYDRGKGEPSLIASFMHGALELFPNEIWPQEMLELLVDGKYTGSS